MVCNHFSVYIQIRQDLPDLFAEPDIEPVVIPPDPIVDTDFVPLEPVVPIVIMGEPKYQLRDLLMFSGENVDNPQEFIHQFKPFLTDINHTVNTAERAEKTLTYFGS